MIKYPDKEKVLAEFKEKYVGDSWINNFIKSDELYKSNKEYIDEMLVDTFSSICQRCICLQNENLKGKINYIYFSILRTSILEDRGEFRIDFYDENWFLDKIECSININVNFIYTSIFELKKDLMELKKQCGRTITHMDVEDIILDEADKYNILAVEFIKDFVVSRFIKLPSYKEMKKSNNIKIMAGELMDNTEIVYEMNN